MAYLAVVEIFREQVIAALRRKPILKIHHVWGLIPLPGGATIHVDVENISCRDVLDGDCSYEVLDSERKVSVDTSLGKKTAWGSLARHARRTLGFETVLYTPGRYVFVWHPRGCSPRRVEQEFMVETIRPDFR